jgi:hypothetical protein
MLTSKQKVFKKIYMRYLDKLSDAQHEHDFLKSVKISNQAEENKRLHLLALNSIM